MITYDDANLRKMFEELDPKRRMQALKGAFRDAANKTRKKAIGNLRSSGLKSKENQSGLEKSLRRLVYKKVPGFRLTVGTKKANKNGKGAAGFHTNRFGKDKPVLLWAETGTKERKTKTSTRFGRLTINRKKKGHSTGKMPKFDFMEKTKEEATPQVAQELRESIVKSVTRIAKKYGCK